MYLIRRWRGAFTVAFLILALLATERRAESFGDTLQVALPIAGLGCALVTGEALEYTVRYIVMWSTVRTAKHVLPHELNARPDGGGQGFPSGHTSSASFGASSLVFSCLAGSPILQTAVVFAAAFTGASRLEVSMHNIWQVLAGGVWAVGCERLLRRPGRLRTRLLRFFGRGERA